jgi:hypothetical protein
LFSRKEIFMDPHLPTRSTAADGQLGAFLAEHAYRGSKQQLTWAILGFVIAGFAALALVGALMAAPEDRSTIAMIALAPAALAAILLALAYLRNPTVRVFADGLAIVNGNRVERCRWDEVEAFWQQLTVNQATLGGIPITSGVKIHQYRVRRRDGKEFKFEENYRQVAELGEAIRCRTFPHLLAAAKAKVAKGESAAFGETQLDRTGIQGRLGTLTWDEIKACDVAINDGMLIVGTGYQRKWGSDVFEKGVIWNSIGDIPNCTVLLAMIAGHRPIPESLRRAFLDGLPAV